MNMWYSAFELGALLATFLMASCFAEQILVAEGNAVGQCRGGRSASNTIPRQMPLFFGTALAGAHVPLASMVCRAHLCGIT